jgi:hypothetical protein
VEISFGRFGISRKHYHRLGYQNRLAINAPRLGAIDNDDWGARNSVYAKSFCQMPASIGLKSMLCLYNNFDGWQMVKWILAPIVIKHVFDVIDGRSNNINKQ